MKQLKPLFVSLLSIATGTAFAQGVAVNNSGATAHASSMLDVSSTTKGMLVPRMTNSQRDAISAPATGLLIYQVDGTQGFYYFDGSSWKPVGGSGSSTGFWDPSGPNIFNNNGGKVGIGTSSPLAKLHVEDSSVLFSAPGFATSASPDLPPVSGAGRRMMWYPDKAAFRAGGVSGAEWDMANVGNYSFAAGSGVTASGENSVALGYSATASAPSSVAIGSYGTASGDNSLALAGGSALGNNAVAAGGYAQGASSFATPGGWAEGVGSVAMISGAHSIGDNSVALGQSTASGLFSMSTGYNTTASGEKSTAMGNTTTASGQNAVAMGNSSTASGENSVVVGSSASAIAPSSVAIGTYANASGENSLALAGGSALGISAVAAGGYAQGASSFATPGGWAEGVGSVAMISGAHSIGDNSVALGQSTASGLFSMSTGYNTTASGEKSTAMGNTTTASGQNAVAMGNSSTASGENSVVVGSSASAIAPSSVAIGTYANASGENSLALGGGSALGINAVAAGGYAQGASSFATPGGWAEGVGSVAMISGAHSIGDNSVALGQSTASGLFSMSTGYNTEASGERSTAMGAYIATGGHAGAFAIGDNTSSATTNNDADNQMMMRFAGGYKLYSDAGATVGTVLAPGASSWSTISDRRKKENFSIINGEAFLGRISNMEITSWNYKGQDPKLYRHYGPMAQDFYEAFGHDSYGTVGNDTTIGQADMEGVSFAMIQALERRTREQASEIATLKAELASYKKKDFAVEALVERLEVLEASLSSEKRITNK